jgi:hypothetical protein
MSKHVCADCGKELEWVGSGPDWMNSYQWDAVKAGDYFAECDKATHKNGNCYFWKHDGNAAVALTPAKKVSP